MINPNTFAALIYNVLEEVRDETPPDINHIITTEGDGGSANIIALSTIQNIVRVTLDDGSRYRIDVVRVA